MAEQLIPNRASTAEVTGIRHRELKSVCDRLGNIARLTRAKRYGEWSVFILGAAIPEAANFAQSTNFWKKGASWGTPIDLVISVVLLLIGIFLRKVSRDIREQHADSIEGVKQTIDDILAAYDLSPLQVTTSVNPIVANGPSIGVKGGHGGTDSG
jgi:hypothetical protein